MPRLFVRRSLTAVGIYSSVALGYLTTVAASRELHSTRAFGDYATDIFTTGFLQSFFDLTVEEALVNLREALELYFEDETLPEGLEPPIIATVELSA